MCALVTGVQTCALPILSALVSSSASVVALAMDWPTPALGPLIGTSSATRWRSVSVGRPSVTSGPVCVGPVWEIGSKACRERVCQYVEISVRAVSYKQKENYKQKSNIRLTKHTNT